MANAIAVLDAVRERVAEDAHGPRSSGASRSSSTPACASSRSTRSCARWRSSGRSSAASATASPTSKQLRFRYGVQVNSLGLTESQPENNVQRIVLEALAVTLGRNARARAIQLPGLERGARPAAAVGPAVVAAHPAGARLRDRPARVPRHLRGLEGHGRARRRAARGRARPRWPSSPSTAARSQAVDYMKAALVDSHRERIRRIEAGEQIVVGVNHYTETEPLAADRRRRRRHPHRRPGASRPQQREARRRSGARAATRPRSTPRWTSCAAVAARRREHHARDDRRRPRGRDDRRVGAGRCATSFGEYRAPTGVGEAAAGARGRGPRGAARGGRARQRGARAAAEDPRRQARPRRALQRRRADRRPRARRRHGRRLRGHPPDAVADRRERAAGGRPRRRPVDPVAARTAS